MKLLTRITKACLLWQICNIAASNNKMEPCETREFFADCTFRNLTDIPNNLPENITSLNMMGNEIRRINGTIWQNYSSLRNLSIARNRIYRSDENSFTGLGNLEKLDLSLNIIKYSHINKNAFKPLTSLIYLDLKQSLDFYPDEIYPPSLTHLSNLKSLMIDGLGEQLLPKLPHLTDLYLSGQYGRCNITYFNKSIISNLESIEKLYLSTCSISAVEDGVLNGFQNITSLDLSENFKLGFSSINKICSGVDKSSNFKRLNLNRVHNQEFGCNSLTVQDVRQLNHTRIELLTLDGNIMWALEKNAVFYLPSSLKYLSFRENSLMLAGYAYDVLNSDIFQNLVYYDSSQQFSSFVPMLGLNKNSRSFEVDTNYKKETFFTRDIYKDYFQIIDEQIEQYKITPYDFDYNLPRSKGANVEYLNLADNFPSTVKSALELFQNASMVKFLNLSSIHPGYPNLSDDEIFFTFTSLVYLDLSNNQIEDIHYNAFEKQIHLESLYLSGNKLTDISFNINLMPKLKYLDLEFNNIDTFSKDSMQMVDRNENLIVNLLNNKLKCTCENIYFVNWIMKHSKNFYFLNLTTCFSVNEKTNFGKLNLEKLNFRCALPYTVCASLVIFTFLIITVLYRLRWHFRYFYYMTKIRLAGKYQPLEGREFLKDVFVSYAMEDHDFVIQQIIPELEENGETSLFLHERDDIVGESVLNNMMTAITKSRKTLVVLTQAYIESNLCIYELNMARMEEVDTGRNVLCIILKENIPSENLPIDVIGVIKKNKYMEFPEDEEHHARFWTILRESLSLAD